MREFDLIQFVVIVLILGIVAVFTWVRKTIEKMQAGKEGEKLNVAQSVRAQIRKYMEAASDASGGMISPPRPEAGAEVMTATPRTAAPPPAPATEPRAAPPVIKRESLRRPKPKPEPVIVRRRIRRTGPAVAVKHGAHIIVGRSLGPGDLKRALVLAEIFGPPMAVREEHRLF